MMPAQPDNAQDFEVAQRRGAIYLRGLTWTCTTSGRSLLRGGNYLWCPHCGLTILWPEEASKSLPGVGDLQ